MKIEEKEGAVFLWVKVVPNSSRTAFAGRLGDALKIKVAQPPEDGKANRAVEELLAETLRLPKSSVLVVAGHTRPQKQVSIVGLSAKSVEELLLIAMGSDGALSSAEEPPARTPRFKDNQDFYNRIGATCARMRELGFKEEAVSLSSLLHGLWTTAGELFRELDGAIEKILSGADAAKLPQGIRDELKDYLDALRR